ncbi:BEL1-like homeodomain protein 9 [Diospyros lotus]|uniref:BEL1-like homeodomain protein 9 n=1 Tax=Diospyros lotus TaxID=55363 RepID=UPI0022518520|nr:BEL1-like homeodomain protein 9 [Diospyros lotus]
MAEGFEPYHVPQQSRRDKLREVVQGDPAGAGCVDNLQRCAGLLPLYDPSLLPSDLLTCAKPSPNDQGRASPCKAEGVNLMGYFGGIVNASSSSSTSQQLYMDPQSSMHVNPSSIQDMNGNAFLFSPQNIRGFDQAFNGGGDIVVYKPEALPQGLSLSLSSHNSHQSSLPLELNLQRYESSMFNDKVAGGGYVAPGIVGGSTSNDLSRSSVPLGPFTGYASILKGSRFLKPAQQLLEELCDVGRGFYAEKISADSSSMDPPMENLGGSGIVDDSLGGGDSGEHRRKKSRLISMLDEVYRRYKYYYQQMQAVVASFESVAGLSNAAPFANLALKAMSKHFRNLKNAITDQLQFTSKAQNYKKDENPGFGNPDNLYSQRPAQNSKFLEHQPVWRPQRGLPERAVTVLRAWLFDHFLHPYPTDTDKLMLARQTGLSRSQVSNWFINARVRLWKPMVEEMHMLETHQAQKASQREEQNADRPSDHLPTATSLASENPSTSAKRTQDLPSKRTRNEFADISMGTDDPVSLSYENLSRHQHVGVAASTAGGSGGVSLTLGLHQNNGIGLSEPFPINAARRFGLDSNSEGYVLGSFEAQNRQFGRDIMGSQLLHDFVG